MRKTDVKISHWQLAALLAVSGIFTLTAGFPHLADRSVEFGERAVWLAISAGILLLA